jgi:pyruvate formate-lyase activating enzyme-like uncharacterized protein
MKIQKTPYYSYRVGQLARGCQLCVKGLKEVLFVTGLCSQRCFFCPLSEAKKNRDVVYANEWPIKNLKEILTEALLCDSQGAGITGGDPLLRLERTAKIIAMLKRNFGKGFHVHLYTPLPHAYRKNLRRLHQAGLDEIRFHPELKRRQDWKKILLAREFDWDVGVEIPVIPGCERETRALITFIHDKVDFLNLNELEISSTNGEQLAERGFAAKNKISYGVKGSEELAIRLLRYCRELQLRTHYCTTTLKDRVQLAKRIKRRAGNVAQPFDYATKEGMLVRGAVYLPGLAPGFGYRDKIARSNKKEILRKLEKLQQELQEKFHIIDKMIAVDERKLRLLSSVHTVRNIARNTNCKCAIVEEYPTYDQFEVDVEFV